jgi:tRNA modification GTPase
VSKTIVALSTPPGTSGLAVLRLSGPACRAVAGACLGRPHPEPRHVYYGAFRASAAEPAERSSGGAAEILDRLNYVFFPGPASATGEDVLELYPHGNPLLIERILRALLAQPGMRLAGPGEFTRRGFEHGKIDLLQAEAVGQLIHAETVQALRNARRMAEGGLGPPLKALRDALVDLSVRLELDVDFSEEEADPDYASWAPRLEAIQTALGRLSDGFDRGRELGRPPRVAVLGAPNAGKSSLINALAESDRLLVSDLPGTTRDWVEVTLTLPGGRVQLVDTAGLGRPVDGLDELAMERTRRQWREADLRVWVEDGTLPPAEARAAAGAEAPEIALRIRTKSDLAGFRNAPDGLAVSNPTGAGLDLVRARLDALAFRDRGAGEDILLTTERQFQAVAAARERVAAALAGMRRKPAIEILAFEIREAAGHLQGLLGEISTDEILGRIFAGFCIGK